MYSYSTVQRTLNPPTLETLTLHVSLTLSSFSLSDAEYHELFLYGKLMDACVQLYHTWMLADRRGEVEDDAKR